MNVVLKNVLVIILGALTLGFSFGVEPSQALEELKVYRGILILEGKIVRGDYDKLRNFLGTKSNFDKINSGVFLASPGGDIAEAMKIGWLIRALQLSTDAPSGPPRGIPKFGESLIKAINLVDPKTNYLCASACFLVYISGVYRKLNWVGRLGVHRPVRLEDNSKTLSVDQELNLTWRVRGTVKQYVKEMNVPDKYVDLIYSVPPNEVRWITQIEFDSDLHGFIPELRDWVGRQCDPQSSKEEIAIDDLRRGSAPLENVQASKKGKIFSETANESVKIVECWTKLKTELSNEAWSKLFPGK